MPQQDKISREQDLADLLNHQGWEWLQQELDVMYQNAVNVLKDKNCDSRDFFAGKCSQLDDISRMVRKFKEVLKIKK